MTIVVMKDVNKTMVIVLSLILFFGNFRYASGMNDKELFEPIVKVYAYQREIVPGIPSQVREQKNEQRYYIYLEARPSESFIVNSVWLNGKNFSVDTEIRETPIN